MFLLDTCTISDFLKCIDPILHQRVIATPSQHFFVSALSIDEIEYGLSRNPEKEKKFRPRLSLFLKEITPAHILPIDTAVASEAGRIRGKLSQTGIVIEQYDLLIGVTTLVHGLTMVTSNVKHFSMIPDLPVENWRNTINNCTA